MKPWTRYVQALVTQQHTTEERFGLCLYMGQGKETGLAQLSGQ